MAVKRVVQKRLRLSKSSVDMYLKCPRSYKYSHIEKIKTKADYPRLAGVEVHKFIARLRSSRNNKLYFKSLETARSAWFGTWSRALEKAHPLMLKHTAEGDEKFGAIGWVCIRNYWNNSIDKSEPKFIEKRFEVPLFQGVDFVGVVDQISELNPETIARIRPDLIANGALLDGFNPDVIIDFKTGRDSYDITEFVPDATELERARYQTELHLNLQVTAYYWLYFQIFKKMPVGFYWYHLLDNKAFLTTRTEDDFGNFIEIMEHVVEGITSDSFPINPEKQRCARCDYFDICNPPELSEPSEGIEFGGISAIWPKPRPPAYKQLRFKFSTPTIGRNNKRE